MAFRSGLARLGLARLGLCFCPGAPRRHAVRKPCRPLRALHLKVACGPHRENLLTMNISFAKRVAPKFLAACLLALFIAGGTSASFAAEIAQVAPAAAAERVAAGEAVLVDVREPAEWENGVAAPAHLLALSDLRNGREQWTKFLKEIEGGKEVLLYCRTGNRSGIAARILAAEGVKVANVGGFSDWQAAGLPERKPSEARAKPAPKKATPKP